MLLIRQTKILLDKFSEAKCGAGSGFRLLFGFDPRSPRGTVGTDDLDHDITILGPHKMRLFCRLCPDTPRRKSLHDCLIELLSISHEKRSGDDRDDPLIGMKVRLDFCVCRDATKIGLDACMF